VERVLGSKLRNWNWSGGVFNVIKSKLALGRPQVIWIYSGLFPKHTTNPKPPTLKPQWKRSETFLLCFLFTWSAFYWQCNAKNGQWRLGGGAPKGMSGRHRGPYKYCARSEGWGVSFGRSWNLFAWPSQTQRYTARNIV